MTVEISMYPFNEKYRDLIGDFIVKLNEYPDLTINTFPTSTMLIGEFEQVMNVLGEMFKWSFETHGKAVFVTKFLPGYDAENP